MKYLLLLMTAFVFFNASNAQQTTAWKDKVVGEWKYAGTEEFGVVTPPDTAHSNDRLKFNADGSFSAVTRGKESSGTYKINEAAKTLTLDETNGKSKLYYLKKSDAGVLTVETQTPDLVRTRHRYAAVR